MEKTKEWPKTPQTSENLVSSLDNFDLYLLEENLCMDLICAELLHIADVRENRTHWIYTCSREIGGFGEFRIGTVACLILHL